MAKIIAQPLPWMAVSSRSRMNEILDAVISKSLPEDSSRQVVKRELFKRSLESVSDKVVGSRRDRRELARRIAKDLFKKGKRLTD